MAKGKMRLYGFQEFIDALSRAGKLTNKAIGHGLYYGADVVAEYLRNETEALPVDNGNKYTRMRGLTAKEKEGLLSGFGISHAKSSGDIRHISVGFGGYGVPTKRWQNGIPNVIVARSLCKGTTFMRKNDFISRAGRKSKAAAEQAMKAAAERVIEKAVN